MTDGLQLIIKFAPARCLSFAWLFRKGEAFLYWIKLKLREKNILYFFIVLLTQLDTLLCSWPHMLAISKVLRHVAEQAGLNLFPTTKNTLHQVISIQWHDTNPTEHFSCNNFFHWPRHDWPYNTQQRQTLQLELSKIPHPLVFRGILQNQCDTV